MRNKIIVLHFQLPVARQRCFCQILFSQDFMLRREILVTFAYLLFGFINLSLDYLYIVVQAYRRSVHLTKIHLKVKWRRLLLRWHLVWRRLILHSAALVAHYSLLRGHTILIVVEVWSAEQEAKVRIVLLLLFGHVLELSAVASDKLRQLIDYVLQIWIYNGN